MNFANMGSSGADLGRSIGRGVQALFTGPHIREQAAMQSGLMGAQRSLADQQTRGLDITNNWRENIDDWIAKDPDMAELKANNPHAAQALRMAWRQFAAAGNPDIAGASGKFLNPLLTGLGAQAGLQGDLPKQNRLIAAATGKTHMPYSALGNTGYVINPETGNIGVGSDDMVAFFRQVQAAQNQAAGKTPLQRNLEAAGFAPGTPEYQDAMLKGLGGGTTVNVNPGKNKFDDENAKAFAEQYKKINLAAMTAYSMLDMLDLAEQALLRKLGAALGIPGDPAKLSGGELLLSIQNKMALMMRSPDAGMGMPGALSDRDIQFLQDAQIGIDRSPEGNRRMLAAARLMEKRKIELARLAAEYIAEHDQLDTGFEQAVREYANANPLFPTRQAAQAAPPAAAPPAAAPPAAAPSAAASPAAAPSAAASPSIEENLIKELRNRIQNSPEFAESVRQMVILP